MTTLLTVLMHTLMLILALPVSAAGVYLLVLTVLSWRLPRPLSQARSLRFDILVPAHDEAAVIERTVSSLVRVTWPKTQFRVLVIADNCTDNTAELAAIAGAEVLSRTNATLRGKGYALEYGVAQSAADGQSDAVVVVDADTVVSPNLLEACAARIERGAEAMQTNYGVLNPDDSWRTRLITIAYGAFHAVRSRARERMGVSCGLRGNGMCLTHALLRKHPFKVYSLAEDLEYGILLGMAGVRVQYIDEASADAELIASERGSRSQRQRWEGGRFAVVRKYAVELVRRGVRGDKVCFDLACDLLLFPLGYVALHITVLALLAAVLLFATSAAWVWVTLAFALYGILVMHVLRGWQLTPLGPRALLDLGRAPFFVGWKVLLMLRQKSSGAWIKTSRDQP